MGARRSKCNFLICKAGANSQVGKLWLRLEDIRLGVKKWDRRLWTELIWLGIGNKNEMLLAW